MVQIADLDVTRPDGATEPVAVLDDSIKEVKQALKTGFGAEHSNANGSHAFPNGTSATRPPPGTDGRLYINEETKIIEKDDGTAWTALIRYYQRTLIGTYTGDGASNKPIVGLGFAPTGILVFPLGGTNPSFFKGINHPAGDSHRLTDGATVTDGILTLGPDGFNVDPAANVAAVIYQFVAVRDRA